MSQQQRTSVFASALFWGAQLASVSPARADAIQEARIFPTPRLTSQIFGLELSFDGTTIACGAGFENSPSTGAGAAYLFRQNASGVWTQIRRLNAPNAAAADYFGTGLAIEGSRVMAGSPGRTTGPVADAGAVFVFEESAGAWNIVQTLTPSNPIGGGGFGDVVMLRGDLAVVTGWTAVSPSAGQFAGREVYFFERQAGTWVETARLAAPAAYSNGFSPSAGIAYDGRFVAVGGSAEQDQSSQNIGAVAIYERSGATWQQTSTLIAAGLPTGTRFGQSVALAGGRLAVGAPNETINGQTLAGAVYRFEWNGSAWSELPRLLSAAPATRDFFGVHLSMTSAALLVGAYESEFPPFTRPGFANLYSISNGQLSSPQTLRASDGVAHDIFGWRTALHGSRAVITAPFHTLNQGAAYVFGGITPPCPADVNGDGEVGLADLSTLLSNFGSAGAGLAGDIDADQDVDLQDLATLLAAFGTTC